LLLRPSLAILEGVTVFKIASRILLAEGLPAVRGFIGDVNAHIDALDAWELRRAAFSVETALRGTPEPERNNCDSDRAFQSVHRIWAKAQAARSPCPAPSAPIRVERAIEVHTAADGSRTYTYGSEWCVTAYRDPIIQRNKEVR
jgi:hypothetical protein